MCVCTTAMACCVYIYIMKKWIPLCFILSLHLFLLLLSLLSLIIHSSCYFQFSSHASRLALLDFIFLCMFSYYVCHYAQIEQGELLILISVLLLLRHFLCHIHALSLSPVSHVIPHFTGMLQFFFLSSQSTAVVLLLSLQHTALRSEEALYCGC